MKQNRFFTKILVLLLAAAMLMGMLPLAALANAGYTAPAPIAGATADAEASVAVGASYMLDLSAVFTEPQGASYWVRVGDGDFVPAEADYCYTPTAEGKTILTFRAGDGAAETGATYTVALTAVSPAEESEPPVASETPADNAATPEPSASPAPVEAAPGVKAATPRQNSAGMAEIYIVGDDGLIAMETVDISQNFDISQYSSSVADGYTALHGIVAALRSAGLEKQLSCSGGYITSIGDLVAGQPNYMSGWMCAVNDKLIPVGVSQFALSAGDELVLFWSQGLDNQQYAKWDVRKATVRTGEKLTLSALIAPLDVEKLGVELPFVAVGTEKLALRVYVDGKEYTNHIAQSKNQIDLYFTEPGTHIVTAKAVYKAGKGGIDNYLTLPVCVVTVTGDALPAVGGLSALKIKGNKGQDEFTSFTLQSGVKEQDLYLNVPYESTGITYNFVRDDQAQANGASVYLLRTINANSQILQGNPARSDITSKESKDTQQTFTLAPGDNLVRFVVQGEQGTTKETIYNVHIHRAEDSPDAELTTLRIKVENKLVSVDSQDFDPSSGYARNYYRTATGELVALQPGLVDQNERDYFVYVPYHTSKLSIAPAVANKGTYEIVDEQGQTQGDIINFTGVDQAKYTVRTTSSDKTNHEEYTVTFLRRPEVALADISINNGRLWTAGLVPGYNEVGLFITDFAATDYTVTVKAIDGVDMYLGSVAPENKVPADGRITRSAPTPTGLGDSFSLVLVRDLGEGVSLTATVKINVTKKNASCPTEMVEFVSSPSQHMTNTLTENNLGGGSLSAFGGYVTYRYDEPIQNDPRNPYGIDFIVDGNPNYPNVWSFSEPAQVYVAQDKNGDGEPDQWYALAGSEHYEDSTYWDYRIEYVDEGDRNVRWTDNYGNSGYVCGLSSGTNFPSAEVLTYNSKYRTAYEQGRLTLSGILVGPVKAENMTPAPVTIFGYGDCYPSKSATVANPYRDPGLSSIDTNLSAEDQEKAMTDLYGASSSGDGMDISWAVDAEGHPVYLDEISFVKMQSAINVDSGSFSEKSPEIARIRRLSVADDAQPVQTTSLPDQVLVNGRALDLSQVQVRNGQATAQVYLAAGETAATVSVEAGERNVILGNRRVTERTYDSVPEDGRMVRIITQEGEQEPNILVLTIRHGSETVAAVEALIDALGTVTKDSGVAINTARQRYEQLTGDEKQQVTNYATLVVAEKAYHALMLGSLNNIYQQTGAYLHTNVTDPVVASIGGEWAVIGLARAGYPVSADYFDKYVANLIDTLQEKDGVLHNRKYTEYSRVVLALSAIGYDVTDVGGYNLLEPLADFNKVIWQGINGPIWALIALDSREYEIPQAPAGVKQTTREALIQLILKMQLDDGGWALSGAKADPDITAMAIQALAPYCATDAGVRTAVEEALVTLSSRQNDQGGFGSWGSANSESCAQVIVALTALGIDPTADARFIKNGYSLVDALLSFYVDGGGFKHTHSGNRDGMATEQGYYALAAYYRLLEGKTSLYDMTDVQSQAPYRLVVNLIDAIGAVTPARAEAIRAARAAYDALPATQRAKVTNYGELQAAERKLRQQLERIDAVVEQIDGIGEVSLARGKAIRAARKAYEALSAAEQPYVTNYATLTRAETKLTQLQAANEVMDLIEAIGTVNSQSGSAIRAARKAYNALSGTEKALVTNYATLTAAERAFKALQQADEPTVTPAPTKAPATPVPGGDTKTLDDGKTTVTVDGQDYAVTEAVAAVIEAISAMPQGETYDLEAVLAAYRLFAALPADQQEQVVNYDDLEAQMNRVGEDQHRDQASGLLAEGLPWHVRLQVEVIAQADADYQALAGNVGSNALLSMWNISLIDILTGAAYQPTVAITLRAPALAASQYERIAIARWEDEQADYLDCQLKDGEAVWQDTKLGSYGLIGIAKESDRILDDEAQEEPQTTPTTAPAQTGSLLWLWIALACLGVVVIDLAVLARMGKFRR